MLTRFVRVQLAIFTVLSVIGLCLMTITYLQVPTLLGIGKITVTLKLPATGGLYQFSNVSYRGVQVGQVTEVTPTSAGATATLTLDSSPKIPADLQAEVRSVSAVGEQYVDLRPSDDSPPYLRDGDVIPVDRTSIPQAVGPMLDNVSALVDSIPTDRIPPLLDESYQAFNGAGDDLGSLLDSFAALSRDLNDVSDQTRTLIDDSGPLLDALAESGDATRSWAGSLAGVSRQLSENEPQMRTLLDEGPSFATEVSSLLEQVKPTLPVLLANLTSLGKVGVVYHPSLEQLLVLLPPYVGSLEALSPMNNAYGLPLGDFAITVADPAPCTVGFLPPSAWRSPADESVVDTPDGLYCKLPQDSPVSVRGARNYPCMEHPGKRAPTVEMCDSDKPFEPLALRQHITGPYPFDPNLVAAGILPDSRVDYDDRIHAPVEGTPLPPGGGPPGPPAMPVEEPPNQPQAAGEVAPSSFGADSPSVTPSVAVTQYDPHTGKYLTPGGLAFRQTDLAGDPPTWKELLPIS